MIIIYISGIDGCGKTTQAKFLADKLHKANFKAEYIWLRWEPSISKALNNIRTFKNKKRAISSIVSIEIEDTTHNDWMAFKQKLLKNIFLKKIWLFYAISDYYYAYNKKKKNLKADVIVVDRYINDFIIDQAVNLNIPPRETVQISDNYLLRKFHQPNFNIIIDLPAMEGYTRKKDGTSLSYLTTREKYYKEIQGSNTLHIDGLRNIDELSKQISNWVITKLREDLK